MIKLKPQQATMHFPSDFLWGTATAAYQMEGKSTHADWWLWEQRPGAILQGHTSGLACDWWHNAERDFDIAQEMGTKALRLSLDWSRIEPKPGEFDESAIGRYRELLHALHQRGIEPMVTLHHFVNPQWLVELGDFGSDRVVTLFQRYVEKVVSTLGDLVPKWCTVNEPMVYFVLRYMEGKFPQPLQSGMRAGFQAIANLLRCHAAAYHTIKRAYPLAQVGVAHQLRPILAPRGGFLAQKLAQQLSYLFNNLWLDAMTDGRLRLPIGRSTIPHLAGSYDFIGVNYYTYSNVAWPPSLHKLYDDTYPPQAIVGDGNYGEIYPEGMFTVLKMAQKYGKPIYVTEHGMPDHDDDHRPMAILSHLRELWRAINFNFPIMGYYHWSLIDNFEWERGWTQRFGLIALDVATQKRTWRPSAHLYQQICQSNALTQAMFDQHGEL